MQREHPLMFFLTKNLHGMESRQIFLNIRIYSKNKKYVLILSE